MKLTKLLRKTDVLEEKVKGITEINQHCVLIKKGARVSNYPAQLIPDKFYSLDWDEFKKGMRFAHILEINDVVKISLAALRHNLIIMRGENEFLSMRPGEAPLTWFEHKIQGYLPGPINLGIDYLQRLVTLSKKETKSVSWISQGI